MHRFSPENWQRLENASRYELLPPEKILRGFGLKKGMSFVDVGAGTGFFSRAAAQIVGESGKVFALDVSQQMIETLQELGVTEQVKVFRSKEYEIPLQDSVADMTWLAFVTHENPDVPRLVREAARITTEGGKIVIVEWKKQDEEMGPPMHERLGQDTLKGELKEFRLKGEGSLNSSHYYIEIEVKKP